MEVASVFCDKRLAGHGRKRRRRTSNVGRVAILAAIVVALYQCLLVQAQFAPGRPQAAANPNQVSPSQDRKSDLTSQAEAETQLQTGTTLSRKGLFSEAIPHLLAARGRVVNEYAANFNLALCYAGTGQPAQAIEVLNGLRSDGHDGADVENLLAQAYVANAQPQQALASLKQAVAQSPQNEKLYVFVAEACRDHKDYGLGLTVIEMGLRNLPQSARLHYERAMFLVQLDQLDQAKPEFELAKLAPTSEIAYLAAAHEELFEGDIPGAIRSAREGVRKGDENAVLLTVLGEALIRSGVSPGQPEFAEAQAALEKAVMQRPNDPTSQIVLGSLDLMAGHLEDAIAHLEKARQIDPGIPSVYANLAKAYQRHGNVQQAHDALAALEKLNREQGERISSAPGDRKLGYAGRAVTKEESATAPP
jgi:predicted Zn-dependent protease